MCSEHPWAVLIGQALALARPDLCRSLILCHTAPRMSIPPEVLARRVEALGTMPLAEYAEIVVEQACSSQRKSGTTGLDCQADCA